MSYPNRDVFLSKNEQENIRKMLGPAKTVSEYLGKAAKYLKEGKGLAKSLADSRDYSREEDRPRYDFSRDLAYLLAPQWVAPNVWDHLQRLIEWEISRAATAANASPDDSQLSGLPTRALSFDRWKYVRDGLADLWEWWCDCAHLRPQVKTDRWKKSDIEPPFVMELSRLATPLTAEENEALLLESSTSIDAHLGDALCQICAMAHFYIAVNEGLEQIDPGTLEYVKSDGKRMYQRLAKRHQIELVLFAPGGKDVNVKAGLYNPNFKHYCARINSAFGSPLRKFPSRAILTGVYLTGADLSFSIIIDTRLTSANLNGADLNGANLYRANLSGASLKSLFLDDVSHTSVSSFYTTILSGANLREASLDGADLLRAFGLTREQVESAWIDERTRLPEYLETVKSEILERQQLSQEPFKEISERSPAPEVEAPEERQVE